MHIECHYLSRFAVVNLTGLLLLTYYSALYLYEHGDCVALAQTNPASTASHPRIVLVAIFHYCLQDWFHQILLFFFIQYSVFFIETFPPSFPRLVLLHRFPVPSVYISALRACVCLLNTKYSTNSAGVAFVKHSYYIMLFFSIFIFVYEWGCRIAENRIRPKENFYIPSKAMIFY